MKIISLTALISFGLIVVPVAGTASAGLSNCTGNVIGGQWRTICTTATAGNPYPENQQRATVNCRQSGSDIFANGPWRAVNQVSGAPQNSPYCNGTIYSTGIQKQ